MIIHSGYSLKFQFRILRPAKAGLRTLSVRQRIGERGIAPHVGTGKTSGGIEERHTSWHRTGGARRTH